MGGADTAQQVRNDSKRLGDTAKMPESDKAQSTESSGAARLREIAYKNLPDWKNGKAPVGGFEVTGATECPDTAGGSAQLNGPQKQIAQILQPIPIEGGEQKQAKEDTGVAAAIKDVAAGWWREVSELDRGSKLALNVGIAAGLGIIAAAPLAGAGLLAAGVGFAYGVAQMGINGKGSFAENLSSNLSNLWSTNIHNSEDGWAPSIQHLVQNAYTVSTGKGSAEDIAGAHAGLMDFGGISLNLGAAALAGWGAFKGTGSVKVLPDADANNAALAKVGEGLARPAPPTGIAQAPPDVDKLFNYSILSPQGDAAANGASASAGAVEGAQPPRATDGAKDINEIARVARRSLMAKKVVFEITNRKPDGKGGLLPNNDGADGIGEIGLARFNLETGKRRWYVLKEEQPDGSIRYLPDYKRFEKDVSALAKKTNNEVDLIVPGIRMGPNEVNIDAGMISNASEEGMTMVTLNWGSSAKEMLDSFRLFHAWTKLEHDVAAAEASQPMIDAGLNSMAKMAEKADFKLNVYAHSHGSNLLEKSILARAARGEPPLNGLAIFSHANVDPLTFVLSYPKLMKGVDGGIRVVTGSRLDYPLAWSRLADWANNNYRLGPPKLGTSTGAIAAREALSKQGLDLRHVVAEQPDSFGGLGPGHALSPEDIARLLTKG